MKYPPALFYLSLLIQLATRGADLPKGSSADTTYPGFNSLIKPGAKLQLAGSGYAFTEGPAPDKKGNIYFTDQPNNRIWKFDTKGELTIFMEPAGRSNGLAMDKSGNLICCADEKDQLWSIDSKGKTIILIQDFGGKILNGPNDVWIHPTGDIYLTDPYYQRDYWKRKGPDIIAQNVYLLRKGEKELRLAADSLVQPNGITGTPNGRYLYVADIRANKTYRYTIQKDGSLSTKTLLINQGSDGMTVDVQGNIYLSGNGITIYTDKGEKREHIDVPAKWTGNLCFGGKDRSLLFITASESIFTIQMKVKGIEEAMR